MFRKTRAGASVSPLTSGLPEERRTLAERYTIDAEEAESRASRAADKELERGAEANIRSGTVEREPVTAAKPVADEFPIYGWMQRSAANPDATSDWTRSLLQAEEQRQRGETPVA